MSDWQPIETIPRNCRKLLLYSESIRRAFDTLELEPLGVIFGRTWDGEIIAENTTDPRGYTHWMPLPDPPPRSPSQ